MTPYLPLKAQAEERLVANGGRVNVARRPILDLPSLGTSKPPASDTTSGDEAEDSSPFDVPAFLRRHEG